MRLLNQLQTALEPHLGSKTQAVLEEGLARLGLGPDALDPDRAAVLLKRFVYRALQSQMSAPAARKVIESVLQELRATSVDSEASPSRPQPKLNTEENPRQALQKALSRFKLYFEWPEVQRLRSLVALLEASENEGQPTEDLIQEALEQVKLLEEKLQNALLRQARDISDLEDSLERVKNIGGAKPKRLRSLLKQIKEAQQQDTLATAEVERARKLAADLRKLVESSVVQNPTLIPDITPDAAPESNKRTLLDNAPADIQEGDEEIEILIDFDNLEPEVAERIREIDLAEERRHLESLKDRFAGVLAEDTVVPLMHRIESQLESGEPVGQQLDELESLLEDAHKNALASARARYEWLSERLRNLEKEDPDLETRFARTQLDLIKESIEIGALPADLEQVEQQIKSIEETLAEKKRLQVRRQRLIEEAESLLTQARDALPEDNLPEVAQYRERLAVLEAGLEAGEIDEGLLNRLKTELPGLLGRLAKAGEEARALRSRLLAKLEALPDLNTLDQARNALKERLVESPPEDLEDDVEALVAQASREVEAHLQTIKQRLASYGADAGFLDEALDQLRDGRLPNLSSLDRRAEQAIEKARAPVVQELRRLRAAAERMRELGGEELLERITAAEVELEHGLPNLAPLKTQLQTLVERREAWRRKLAYRYRALRERFEAARAVGGETAYRALNLFNFLEKGASRIERLGASGLSEMERSLTEAEQLVDQLEQEYAAAKEVAEQLSDTDLDDLLGVFETPEDPEAEAEPGPETAPPAKPPAPSAVTQDDGLAPFRTRGVLWVGWLEQQPPEELDDALARDLLADLDLLRQEVGETSLQLAVLALPEHAFLLAPHEGRHLVVLAEKSQLSRLVTAVRRTFTAAS